MAVGVEAALLALFAVLAGWAALGGAEAPGSGPSRGSPANRWHTALFPWAPPARLLEVQLPDQPGGYLGEPGQALMEVADGLHHHNSEVSPRIKQGVA